MELAGWAAWALVAVWVGLVAAPGRYWTTAVRLPVAPDPPAWPAVAVVVPARDEAVVLACTLPGLAAQDYPGPAEVVVVDDRSGDATAEVARSAGTGGRLAVTVVEGLDRPAGWAGKLWALHQGVARAVAPPALAPPEWILFTDADIEHRPGSLRRLVAFALADERDAVSLMARLRVDTGWERLIVPAFVYFFAQLYPFRLVAGRGRTAAAAGGCVLVRRAALDAAGGVAAVRGAVIDDVALARALGHSGARLWLGLADDVCSVRAYPHLGDLWHMVARSAFTQLRYSAALLAATLVGLVLVYLGPPVALVAGLATGRPLLAAAGATGWAVMTASYLPMVRYHRLAPLWALSLPVAALVYAAMTLDSARRHWIGGVEWKGRRYQPG